MAVLINKRSLKNNIIVRESDDIDSFIVIRRKQYSPLGFLMTTEMKHIWKNFYPRHAFLLLAYKKNINNHLLNMRDFDYKSRNQPLAGILILYYDKVTYYWYASSLPEGKKLFAPTLLVWEALKLSKKKDCKIFDFEGIYDERFPHVSKNWKGFTKFKEGFGCKKLVLMENFSKLLIISSPTSQT